MDKGKAKGDYSSAYKLAGSTIDKKTLRLHRRSIEQKELRQGEHNKRRALTDLSPVQEGDATLNQNKHYKDKTPHKPKDDKKSENRLEQLKKWKEERELKKKLDAKARNTKNPVFKCSKDVNHRDHALFKKSAAVGKHPVKPQPVPQPQPVITATKRSVDQVKAASKSKPPPHTSTRAKAELKVPETRTRQTSGSRNTAARVNKEPAKVEKMTKKTSKAVASVPPSTRGQRNPMITERNTRVTRQSARTKGSEAKTKPQTSAPLTSRALPPALEIELSTKITKRSKMESFAPDDFAFNMNAPSFVFKPLSPTSAAVFLNPNPDTSNACSSFFESNPKRSSTPNRDAGKRRSARDVDVVTNKCNNTLMLERTACNMTDTSQLDSTREPTVDNTLTNSPDMRGRRSVRKSVSRSHTLSASDINDNKETPIKELEQTKTSSESVVNTPLNTQDITNTDNDQSTVKKATKSRRSLRRSILSSVNDSETAVIEGSPLALESKGSRSSLRRSILTSSESDNTDSNEKSIDDKATPSRQIRRSVKKSVTYDESSDDASNAPITPSRNLRRSSRRSVATAPDTDDIPEESETVEKVEEVFKVDDAPEVENSTKSRSSKKSFAKRISDGLEELAKAQDKKTPARRGKRQRNKSFGGFILPDANSVVLSAKRKSRKSMMPKSPEEWVNLLSESPMIEMSRRKPKIGNVTVPTLNFDDIDFEDDLDTSLMKSSGMNDEVAMVTQEAGSSTVTMDGEERMEMASTSGYVAPVIDSNTDNTATVTATVSSPAVAIETVQVGEVSSTQDGPLNNEDAEHDVEYFRNLMASETTRLKDISAQWTVINTDNQLTEDVSGQIRTTVGQALLLMDQRFKQFRGLVDNCEYGTGEKETTCTDLQGFWDMIYFQVEDVDQKFADLAKLKANNWQDDKPKPQVKKIKKKVAKPTTTKPAVKSKFGAFRAQMKKQEDVVSSPGLPAEKEAIVFDMPCFFKVSSPVRNPKPHCEAGSTPSKKTTPAITVNSSESSSLPSSGDILLNRTPARKCYTPNVPSPLLVDSTPKPKPAKTSALKPAIPKRLLADITPPVHNSNNKENQEKTTPARRSLRPRKSVNFGSEDCPSPLVTSNEEDFMRLLQPITTQQETMEEETTDIGNDSFQKYLQPRKSQDSPSDKDATSKPGRKRRSSLKECPSSKRRRSSSRAVQFVSPVIEDMSHEKVPCTPYNRDSLVKKTRVTRRSVTSSSLEDVDDVFSIDHIDEDENQPLPTYRSPRPSLLYTPPEKGTRSPLRKRTPVRDNVVTGTLISFTP